MSAFGLPLIKAYDLVSTLFPQGYPLRLILEDTTKQHVRPLTGKISALEIGSGGGETTSFVLNADRRIQLKAIDSDADMVARARKNLKRYGGRVRFVKTDAHNYLANARANQFQIVANGWTLHNFPEKEKNQLLTNIFKVLRPGGLFVSMDKYLPSDPAAEAWYRLLQDIRIRAIDQHPNRDLVTNLLQHELRDNRPPYRMEEHATIQAMQNLGYVGVSVRARCELHGLIVGYKPRK